MSLRLTVNGAPREYGGRASVRALLEELRVNPLHVAVVVNEDVCPREKWDMVILQDGDRVEMLTLAGGG